MLRVKLREVRGFSGTVKAYQIESAYRIRDAQETRRQPPRVAVEYRRFKPQEVKRNE